MNCEALSDVLSSVAEPLLLLEPFRGPDGACDAVQVAASIWNIAQLPDSVDAAALLEAVVLSLGIAPVIDPVLAAYRIALAHRAEDSRAVARQQSWVGPDGCMVVRATPFLGDHP